MLYLAPTVVVGLAVFLYPTFRVIQLSMLVPQDTAEVFAGLKNYEMLFSDPVFHEALLHSVSLMAVIPVLVPVGIVVAALLYENMRGWRLYRSVLFLPYVIAIAVSGIVWSYVLRLEGPLNMILKAVGLGFLAVDWLGKPGFALISIGAIIVWRELGFGVVLLLARLLSLNEEIFESARLDGASWRQVLWYIMVPQLLPVIEFWSIILIVTVLAWVFDYVFVMTMGGPGTGTVVVDFFVYVRAFRDRVMGIAAAASVVLMFASLLLMFVRHRLSTAVEVA
jgi:ABC-type sugar transport system permease subunit